MVDEREPALGLFAMAGDFPLSFFRNLPPGKSAEREGSIWPFGIRSSETLQLEEIGLGLQRILEYLHQPEMTWLGHDR